MNRSAALALWRWAQALPDVRRQEGEELLRELGDPRERARVAYEAVVRGRLSHFSGVDADQLTSELEAGHLKPGDPVFERIRAHAAEYFRWASRLTEEASP